MSASLTLTYDQQLSRVRVSASGLVDAAAYTLQRSTDQVRWTTVRGGELRTPSAGTLSIDDYEFAADVANFYRLRGPAIADDYSRTVGAGSWGAATSGQPYALIGTASAFSVTAGVGRIATASINQLYDGLADTGSTDHTVRTVIALPVVPAGAPITLRAVARAVDGANYYEAIVSIATDGTSSLFVAKRISGAGTNLGPGTVVGTHAAGHKWAIVFEVLGSTLRAKAWNASTGSDPGAWQLTFVDTSLTTGTLAGHGCRRETGNTNGTVNIDVDDLVVTASSGTTVAEGHRTDNANPLFEVDASSWSAIGGTVARSTAQAHQGAASLLLTPDGATGTVEARSENVPATAGASMQATAWVRCASSRTVNININWRNAGGSLLSTSTSSASVPANTWAPLSIVATAPASAAQAQLAVSMAGTPPSSDLLWIDEARIGGPGITPTLDKVWLKSVARPYLNRKVRVAEYTPFTSPARSGIFDVVNRSSPLAVTDLRSSKRFTLDVYADDAADARNLELVLASGDVLFIHAPTTGPLSTVPSGYVAVGDVTQEVLPTFRLDLRRFSLPCTMVAAPGPEVVGVTYTWQSLVNDFATWADVVAAFATWAELLDNVGSPEDVIVP